MKKDPHPMSWKFAEIFSAIVILLVVGGPGVYTLILSAKADWAPFTLFGGIILIGTALLLTSLIMRQR